MKASNNDILTYGALRAAAMKAARAWKDLMYPVVFDHTFPLPGVRVRIRIERAESPEDTKPVFGVDEDNKIAD